MTARWHDVIEDLPSSHYDMVLSSHSIYEYIRHPSGNEPHAVYRQVESLLSKTRTKLSTNGTLCIIVGAAANAVTLLRERFLPQFRGEIEIPFLILVILIR